MADTSAFSIPQPASMTPERLAVLMTAVASSRPRDRANVFAPIEAELTLWLSACDTGNREVLAPGRDHERFLAQARTYLRALSTYKPNTDAWLDVFRAFRHLIEQNTVRPRVAPSAPPVSRLSHAEIRKLQETPGLPR